LTENKEYPLALLTRLAEACDRASPQPFDVRKKPGQRQNNNTLSAF
jgi:hypothetical protein